eukprot:Nk52_evm17s1810 gene=Nk52_evmTU17s1810
MGFLDAVASSVTEELNKTEGNTSEQHKESGSMQEQLTNMFKEHMASKSTEGDDTTEEEKNDAMTKATEFLKEKFMKKDNGEETSSVEQAGFMAKATAFLQSPDFKEAKVKDLPAKMKAFFGNGEESSESSGAGGLASMAKSFF